MDDSVLANHVIEFRIKAWYTAIVVATNYKIEKNQMFYVPKDRVSSDFKVKRQSKRLEAFKKISIGFFFALQELITNGQACHRMLLNDPNFLTSSFSSKEQKRKKEKKKAKIKFLSCLLGGLSYKTTIP